MVDRTSKQAAAVCRQWILYVLSSPDSAADTEIGKTGDLCRTDFARRDTSTDETMLDAVKLTASEVRNSQGHVIEPCKEVVSADVQML